MTSSSQLHGTRNLKNTPAVVLEAEKNSKEEDLKPNSPSEYITRLFHMV